ncbi:hypothetical protein ABFA07_013104 [Porites harrisoni]
MSEVFRKRPKSAEGEGIEKTLIHKIRDRVEAGRYVARKISSAFSRSDTQAQQSPKALDQTNSVPGKSQKYAPVTTDIDDSLVSSTEQKQMGFSYGVISHANEEDGTAQQRVT